MDLAEFVSDYIKCCETQSHSPSSREIADAYMETNDRPPNGDVLTGLIADIDYYRGQVR